MKLCGISDKEICTLLLQYFSIGSQQTDVGPRLNNYADWI
jgi:hypothetical protein